MIENRSVSTIAEKKSKALVKIEEPLIFSTKLQRYSGDFTKPRTPKIKLQNYKDQRRTRSQKSCHWSGDISASAILHAAGPERLDKLQDQSKARFVFRENYNRRSLVMHSVSISFVKITTITRRT